MNNYSNNKTGDIVLIRFPFTDLSSEKVRPALVITQSDNEDILVAPISTTVNSGRDDIILKNCDYLNGPLPIESCVRYKKLFTLSRKLIIKKVNALKNVGIVKEKIIKYIKK